MTTVDRHAPGTPGWFDLMTSDAAAARSFYGGLFGWTFDVKGPEFGHYAMCKLGGRNAAGLVASTDQSCARVGDLGGKVCVPGFDSPYGRIAVIEDPQGAMFSIVQPPA